MSLLRYKQKLLPLGMGNPQGGGGGGGSAPSAPTQTTAYQTNIPEYAQPYVENMLNATQKQLFNIDENNQITGFSPYTPYSNDPTKYVAGFSPLQQQAQSAAANLQTPNEYGVASGLTGIGTMQALGAGQNLQRQSTNPYAVGQYMNPFIQNALAPAQQLLNQQYGMQGAAQQGQATSSGAFGGSRNALMQGLNEQNRMLAQNQLVGNAYQQAYNQAQNQMNQVANLGLQGAQAGIQGAGQLAGIGGQELAAQQGIIGTQTQQGAAQQAQQQQIINQAIQNYATQQQYPLLQLGTMSNMLRGLPMQSQTTQMYQAQPTATQQAIGLGGTAAMLGTAFGAGAGKKEGGIIGMKEGGSVPGFKYGAVINDEQLQSKARNLNDTQLKQRVSDPLVNPNERMIFQGVQADQNRLRQNPGAAQALQQAGMVPQAPAPQAVEQARLSGLGAAGGPAFNSQGFAGGGIIAFADQGLVPEPNSPEAFMAKRESMMEKRGFGAGPSEEEKAYAEALKNKPSASQADLDRALRFNAAKTLADFGSIAAPGGIMQAANMALSKNMPGFEKAYEAKRTADDAALKGGADLKMAQRKFAAGDVDEAWKDYDAYEKNKTTEKVARINAASHMAQGNAERSYVEQLVKQGYSLPDALQIVKGAGRAESVESSNAKIILADIDKQIFALDPKKDAAKIADLQKQRDAIYTRLQTGGPRPQAQPAPANPDAGGVVDVPGKGKFQQLPNGNYIKVG